MSRFLSTYSRIWVELTVSHQAGRETSSHFPTENLSQLLPGGLVRGPAEDHVVVVPGGAGGLVW